MKKIILLTLTLLFSLVAFSQEVVKSGENNSYSNLKWDTGSKVIPCSSFGITIPVRDMPDLTLPDILAKEYPFKEYPDKRDMPVQTFEFSVEKDGPKYGNDPSIVQTSHGKTPSKAPLQNWDGQDASTFRPHDPTGAAGPNHYVQAINGNRFQIWDKSGNSLHTGNITDLCPGGDGDPIVMYDKDADRWFISQFEGSSGNGIFIAISATGDPEGSWYAYSWTSSDFPDYLKFGTWHDGYYMTANYAQKIFAFNRTKMLAGDPTAEAVYQTFSPPQNGFFVPSAADAADGTLPSSGPCPIFCYQDDGWTGVSTDALNIYDAAVTWNGGSSSMTVTLNTTLNTSAFDASYDSGWDDVAQPGTTRKLDGIGGTMMYRTQWKKWSGYNTAVMNWAVQVGSQRGIFWLEARQDQSSGNWSIYQEGIYSPGTDDVWMGSIAMNDLGHIALAYAKANAADATNGYMSLAYTGRLSCDPPGTMTIAEVVAMQGAGSQTGTNRDGDYAHTTVDPDGVTFWHTGEYMKTTSDWYGADTRIFSFQLPGACAAPTNVAASPSSLYEDRGKQITVTGNDIGGCTFSIGGVIGSVASNDGSTAVVDFPAGNYSNSTLTVTNSIGSDTYTMDVRTRNTIPVVAGAGVTSDNHPTIQSAVEGLHTWYGTTSFGAGDLPGTKTINVSAGTFTNEVTLNSELNPVSGNLLVIQNNSGDLVTVNATGNNYGFNLNTVDYVSLKGFTVHSADLDNIYAQGDNVTISYNKTYGSVGGSGIKVETGTPFTVINNLAYSNYFYGIHINSANNIIKNNTTYDNGHSSVGPQVKTYTFSGSVAIIDKTSVYGDIAVSDNFTITNVRVLNMNITHTWDADLDIYIDHPDATEIMLSTDNGGAGDNYVNTSFDDDDATAITAGTAPFTGTYRPEASLTGFDTKNSSGTWRLRVYDDANGDVGTLTSWTLELTYNANEQIGSGVYVQSGTGSTVENNILFAKTGNDSYFSLSSEAGATVNSDYNTYYTTNTNLFDYNGTVGNIGPTGANDLTTDPLFVTAGTDFHIKSTSGSYAGGNWPPTTASGGAWNNDASNSPALDAGNPGDPFGNEPSGGTAIIKVAMEILYKLQNQ